MKKIKVNNLNELFSEVKKYVNSKRERERVFNKNVYRLIHNTEYSKDPKTGKVDKNEPTEGVGVKLNDKVDIYIEEKKDPQQTKKFDELFKQLQKEISKIISDRPEPIKKYSEECGKKGKE